MDDTLTISLVAALPTLVGLANLFSFWKTRKREIEERARYEERLTLSMESLNKTVTALSATMDKQGKSITNLNMTLSLLCQQHKSNHGQELGGGII